jgi:superfamily II DNA/RNA helicase
VQDAAPDVCVRKCSEPKVASPSGGPDPAAPLAIIIEPTRELALQTADVLNQLKQYMTEPALRVVRLLSLTIRVRRLP